MAFEITSQQLQIEYKKYIYSDGLKCQVLHNHVNFQNLIRLKYIVKHYEIIFLIDK